MVSTACAAAGRLRDEACDGCVEPFFTRVGAFRAGMMGGRALDCIERELEHIEQEARRFYGRTGWMACGIAGALLAVVALAAWF